LTSVTPLCEDMLAGLVECVDLGDL